MDHHVHHINMTSTLRKLEHLRSPWQAQTLEIQYSWIQRMMCCCCSTYCHIKVNKRHSRLLRWWRFLERRSISLPQISHLTRFPFRWISLIWRLRSSSLVKILSQPTSVQGKSIVGPSLHLKQFACEGLPSTSCSGDVHMLCVTLAGTVNVHDTVIPPRAPISHWY